MKGALLVKSAAALLTASACIVGLSSCTAATNGLGPPEVGTEQRDCDDCPLMVTVPAGSFTMGSPASEQGRWADEGPQHAVAIAQVFWVGVHEVSFAEWDACVAGGGCSHRPNDYDRGRGNRPVIDVSWIDAAKYTEWLEETTGKPYRLLSESEWEYMARAGTSTARYWGASSVRQCQYANGADESAQREFPEVSWDGAVACDDGAADGSTVGSYLPNDFGIFDALGNVWEWTQDCWHHSYSGAPTDGSAWETETEGFGYCGVAVIRGGGWIASPRAIRSSVRAWLDINDRTIDVGFRVARALTADDARRQRAPTTTGGRPTGGGGGREKGPSDPPGSKPPQRL